MGLRIGAGARRKAMADCSTFQAKVAACTSIALLGNNGGRALPNQFACMRHRVHNEIGVTYHPTIEVRQVRGSESNEQGRYWSLRFVAIPIATKTLKQQQKALIDEARMLPTMGKNENGIRITENNDNVVNAMDGVNTLPFLLFQKTMSND
jgi:hypothetical protein